MWYSYDSELSFCIIHPQLTFLQPGFIFPYVISYILLYVGIIRIERVDYGLVIYVPRYHIFISCSDDLC